MNIDFSTPLNDVYGQPLDEGRVTLAVVSINSLMAPPLNTEGHNPLSGTEMVRLYDLAARIYRSGEIPIEVTPEEATTIRDKIAILYQNPVVVGPAWKLLG